MRLIPVLVLALSVAACGGSEDEPVDDDTNMDTDDDNDSDTDTDTDTATDTEDPAARIAACLAREGITGVNTRWRFRDPERSEEEFTHEITVKSLDPDTGEVEIQELYAEQGGGSITAVSTVSERICDGSYREVGRTMDVYSENGGEGFGFSETVTWTTPRLIRPERLAVGVTWEAGAEGTRSDSFGEEGPFTDDTPFEVIEDGVSVMVGLDEESGLRIRANPDTDRSRDIVFVPGIGPAAYGDEVLDQYAPGQ